MIMALKDELELIESEMSIVKRIFLKTVEILPSFDITDKKVLPYGLKAHTRSVSWIVEQVITQQTKLHAKELGLKDVDIDMPDTSLQDCVLHKDDKKYYVNVKIHNADGKDNKNDISAVEKLYMQYNANPNYRLIYATFGVKFQNITISFVKDYVHVFSPQFLPIYVNPRNDKIQALYHHKTVMRTRKEFLQELREKSTSIVLK
jgi:hypothetical protein